MWLLNKFQKWRHSKKLEKLEKKIEELLEISDEHAPFKEITAHLSDVPLDDKLLSIKIMIEKGMIQSFEDQDLALQLQNEILSLAPIEQKTKTVKTLIEHGVFEYFKTPRGEDEPNHLGQALLNITEAQAADSGKILAFTDEAEKTLTITGPRDSVRGKQHIILQFNKASGEIKLLDPETQKWRSGQDILDKFKNDPTGLTRVVAIFNAAVLELNKERYKDEISDQMKKALGKKKAALEEIIGNGKQAGSGLASYEGAYKSRLHFIPRQKLEAA